jgi:hypothetical protein
MSEHRTKEEISKDYSQAALKAGDLFFNKGRIDAELAKLYMQMEGLVLESQAAQVAELANKSKTATPPLEVVPV